LALLPLLLVNNPCASPAGNTQKQGVDKMRDLIEARLWADHGPQFSADVHKALKWLLRNLTAFRFTVSRSAARKLRRSGGKLAGKAW
jgi:hypothetical protein